MGQRSAANVRCLGQIIAYFSSKLTHITQCNDHQGVPNEYKEKEEGGGDRCIIELFSRAQRTLTSSASTRSTTFVQTFYSFSYNLANVCKKGDSWYWQYIVKQKTERPNQKPTTTVTSESSEWVRDKANDGRTYVGQKNAPVEPTLIALLDLSVIGFSFVFYDKAIRREQGNLNLLDEPWRQEIPPLFQK